MTDRTELEERLRSGPGGAPAIDGLLADFTAAAEAHGLVDIVFASTDSPVGEITVAATDTGILAVGWDTEALLQKLADKVSPRVLEDRARLDDERRQLDEYFAGRRHTFDVEIDWTLTAGFRREVLHELVTVPYGSIVTYGELAERVHNPKASRAVGSAMATNPIPLIVPCHRVLQSGGGLGNYSGGNGPETKAWLLRHEGADLPQTLPW